MTTTAMIYLAITASIALIFCRAYSVERNRRKTWQERANEFRHSTLLACEMNLLALVDMEITVTKLKPAKDSTPEYLRTLQKKRAVQERDIGILREDNDNPGINLMYVTQKLQTKKVFEAIKDLQAS